MNIFQNKNFIKIYSNNFTNSPNAFNQIIKNENGDNWIILIPLCPPE